MHLSRTITISCLLTTLFCMGCSVESPTSYASPPGGSPQNPPLPRTKSILPLTKGNVWTFSTTLYTATGTSTTYNQSRQQLSIPKVFGWLHDTVFTEMSLDNKLTTDSCTGPFVYALEWDSCKSGELVSYLQDVAIRGIYIVGFYQNTSITQYDSARLWLAYPVMDTMTYALNRGPSGDTSQITTMSVISTREKFLFPDSSRHFISDPVFYNCYLYKEIFKDTISYYYYNDSVGAIGYQQVYHGTLRKTYILKRFSDPASPFYP